MSTIQLTSYSKGSGCGCKIAPKVLQEILQSTASTVSYPGLLVGNGNNDDAAVYDLGKGQCLISTTDFFTPVVDDAFDFGRIAAANAISDVYAMGGKPLMAVAILGWPVDKLPPELASKVLQGGRSICELAGIPLAGGHSIDSPEPMFGLAVNGLVEQQHLKRNNTAKEGDLIYLSKKIGVGILNAATKRSLLKEEHIGIALEEMLKLNSIGTVLASLDGLHAMTDVTGFGLLGHLLEMAEGSGLTAELKYASVPLIAGLDFYTAQMCVPDNTFRNWNGYEQKVSGVNGDSLFTLCDPQTNGGLLMSVDPSIRKEFEKTLIANGLEEFSQPIGKMKSKGDKVVEVL